MPTLVKGRDGDGVLAEKKILMEYLAKNWENKYVTGWGKKDADVGAEYTQVTYVCGVTRCST